VEIVHFRKFVSRNLLNEILKLPNLRIISFSRYAYQRCNEEWIKKLGKGKVRIIVSKKSAGRPNLIEKMLVLNDYNVKSKIEKRRF
jgi:hypothetical protein